MPYGAVAALCCCIPASSVDVWPNPEDAPRCTGWRGPHHGQDHQPEDERPDGSPLLAPGLPPDSGAEHDQDQDDAHALIVAAAAGACKPCRARERFQAVPKFNRRSESGTGLPRPAYANAKGMQGICISVRLHAATMLVRSRAVAWHRTGPVGTLLLSSLDLRPGRCATGRQVPQWRSPTSGCRSLGWAE